MYNIIEDVTLKYEMAHIYSQQLTLNQEHFINIIYKFITRGVTTNANIYKI